MIDENPFAELVAGKQTNKARMHFVSQDDTTKLLAACPNHQWKTVIALTRYGGLRCPSETKLLTWPDIDWQKNTIFVRSPKTEHHEGGESRLVPLFPELKAILDDAFMRASDQKGRVVNLPRLTSDNLRTQLVRIIRKAGLKPWPKPFHNMRSSRQTELSARHPIQDVCAWMGNSEIVARGHYLQATDGEWQKAVNSRGQIRDAENTTVDRCLEIHGTLQNENRPENPSDFVQNFVASFCNMTLTGFEPVSRP